MTTLVKSSVLIAIVTVLMACIPGLIAEEQGVDPVAGIETSTCAEFSSTYEHSPDSASHNHDPAEEEGVVLEHSPDDERKIGRHISEYTNWLRDYLMTHKTNNQASLEITATRMAGMLGSLYRWCSTRPQESIVSALSAVLKE